MDKPTRDQIERFMADPERCMPSERAYLESLGYRASPLPAPDLQRAAGDDRQGGS